MAPSNSSRPQVGKSDGKPRPRKDSADSVMMAEAMPRVAETMIELSTFGRIWRRMMRYSRMPLDFAAMMNSWLLIVSTSPRTMRAVCIQLVIPITKTMRMKMPVSGPKAARSVSRNSMRMTSSSGNSGRARNRSVSRISGPSSLRK
ncbi:hypothetical protein D3C78_1262650 [compost metagenome]